MWSRAMCGAASSFPFAPLGFVRDLFFCLAGFALLE